MTLWNIVFLDLSKITGQSIIERKLPHLKLVPVRTTAQLHIAHMLKLKVRPGRPTAQLHIGFMSNDGMGNCMIICSWHFYWAKISLAWAKHKSFS
jgi:hypothetical protein